MFTAALFTMAVTREHPKCSLTEEQIRTQYTHTMEYHSAIRKSETMPLAATWMDESIILSEVRQKTSIL